jgi:diadenosine tetraphosphate (Ap4A) HIT family hydrolase
VVTLASPPPFRRDWERVACPFCALGDTLLVFESDLVVGFRDRYPVSRGHTLLVTRRHVATYFGASEDERKELWRAVEDVKHGLDGELHPDGYNVGFNAGEAAGQTVMHVHVHVIPRYVGDMPDPRGGVRGVIPGKQGY